MSNEFLREQLQRSLVDDGTIRPPNKGLLHAELSHAIVGACIEVHRHVGPGQLEAVYQKALALELRERGIAFRPQVPLAMTYKGQPIGEFYADFIVDENIVIELKAVDHILPAHVAQVISYLRAARLRLGLLINFNGAVLWRNVKRIVL